MAREPEVLLIFMAVPAAVLGCAFWLIEGHPSWLMFAGGAVSGLFLGLYGMRRQ